MAASELSFNHKTLINGSKVNEAEITQNTATSQILTPLCATGTASLFMTDELISKETLQEELDVLKSGIAKRQWRYYYIESIHNFIYHLDSFPSERTQERIAGKIKDYLDLLKKRTNEEHDVHDLAKQLFPDVWKLSREYVDFLGFIKKPSYSIRIALGVILFFVLKSSFDTWIALGSVSIIAITTTAYSEFKIKKRKYW